ncbi:hypothetical protein R52603_01172 [Paraburkholderia saeva]|uniref:Uncharacterized protein n=2 Tax=Paraburkholderia saeva TaxID=2777537 RepID=A0A9N8RXN3_9BURK|nr:hypothetical protein R52603_01172 [Paraburkholderia saeva]CAG4895942.1 hypothetical protein R70241_02103 [Paraburkholderia saeva]CAG4902805.1 hypothetical protein LMG31841_03150 [Paraburkholderia saeva]
MQGNLRRTLDVAYERMKSHSMAAGAFTGNYGLCLGVIMGAQACQGMTDEEVAVERAHLSMLVALHDMKAGEPGRSRG